MYGSAKTGHFSALTLVCSRNEISGVREASIWTRKGVLAQEPEIGLPIIFKLVGGECYRTSSLVSMSYNDDGSYDLITLNTVYNLKVLWDTPVGDLTT